LTRYPRHARTAAFRTATCRAAIASVCCWTATVALASGNSSRDHAAALLAAGEYYDAVAAAETAVREDERQYGKDEPETARSLHVLILCYNAAGQYQRAEPLAERALRIRQRGQSDSLETAESLHDLSETHAALGDHAKAVAAAEQALALRERLAGRESLETAESLNDLGVVHLRMGDVQQAAAFIDRARGIREVLVKRESAEMAESLSNTAAVAWQQNQLEKARQLYEEALAIKSLPTVYGPEHPKVATAHVNLAAVYSSLWRASNVQADRSSFALRAREHGAAARQILAGKPPGPDTAAALENLAWSLLAFAPLTNDEVRDLLRQAIAVEEQLLGAHHPDTVQAQVLLATFERFAGDPKRALTLFQQALPSEDDWLAQAMPVGNESLSLRLAERSQGDYLAALSLVQQHFAADPAAVRFAFASVLRRKGIVLDVASRTQEKYAKILGGDALKSWRHLVELRNELSATLLGGGSGASYKADLENLGNAIKAEEERLRTQSAPLAEEFAQRATTVDAVAAHLPHDAVLIEFVRIRDWDERRMTWSGVSRYLAFVLTSAGTLSLVDLGEANAIDAQIVATLAAVKNPDAYEHPQLYERGIDEALSALYRSVLAPLEKGALAHERIVFSPDGELSRVPFEALRTPAGRFFVEDHVVSQVTSGRDLIRGKSNVTASVGLLMVANPAFDDSTVARSVSRGRTNRPGTIRGKFGPLPGTAQEAQAIEPLVTGTKTVLTGNAATESAVRETHSPRVLHFATHGFFLPQADRSPADPLRRSTSSSSTEHDGDALARSGMALAGANRGYVDSCDEGILCAGEVEEMDLFGTELVVLSACETALGDIRVGEGVYGLRRAFVLAGARNLIMSLWPVDDAVTRDLMTRFYGAYREGTSPAIALHRAQIETIASLRKPGGSTEGVALVSLWAPFIAQQTGE
jgi:CHAT domain-containing protein/tetratricopeptide (TPR) repeat protein